MKKIEIEIPDGKVAKWVNGVLTLVDNKDITERIKTFEDACEELGDEHPLVTQYRLTAAAYKGDPMTEDFIAYLKLRVICTALNENWKPIFSEDESCYYPWFYIYTKEEYEELDEEDKKECRVIGRSSNNSYASGELVCAHASDSSSGSYSVSGSRLAFRTKGLAEYCGKQFIDIWVDFIFS